MLHSNSSSQLDVQLNSADNSGKQTSQRQVADTVTAHTDTTPSQSSTESTSSSTQSTILRSVDLEGGSQDEAGLPSVRSQRIADLDCADIVGTSASEDEDYRPRPSFVQALRNAALACADDAEAEMTGPLPKIKLFDIARRIQSFDGVRTTVVFQGRQPVMGCFTGVDVCEWLRMEQYADTTETAELIGQQLLAEGLIETTCGEHTEFSATEDLFRCSDQVADMTDSETSWSDDEEESEDEEDIHEEQGFYSLSDQQGQLLSSSETDGALPYGYDVGEAGKLLASLQADTSERFTMHDSIGTRKETVEVVMDASTTTTVKGILLKNGISRNRSSVKEKTSTSQKKLGFRWTRGGKPSGVRFNLSANQILETFHQHEYERSSFFDMETAMEEWEAEEDDERRRHLEDRWAVFEAKLPPSVKCAERVMYERETDRLAALTRQAQERAQRTQEDVTAELLSYLHTADRIYNDMLAGIDVFGISQNGINPAESLDASVANQDAADGSDEAQDVAEAAADKAGRSGVVAAASAAEPQRASLDDINDFLNQSMDEVVLRHVAPQRDDGSMISPVPGMEPISRDDHQRAWDEVEAELGGKHDSFESKGSPGSRKGTKAESVSHVTQQWNLRLASSSSENIDTHPDPEPLRDDDGLTVSEKLRRIEERLAQYEREKRRKQEEEKRQQEDVIRSKAEQSKEERRQKIQELEARRASANARASGTEAEGELAEFQRLAREKQQRVRDGGIFSRLRSSFRDRSQDSEERQRRKEEKKALKAERKAEKREAKERKRRTRDDDYDDVSESTSTVDSPLASPVPSPRYDSAAPELKPAFASASSSKSPSHPDEPASSSAAQTGKLKDLIKRFESGESSASPKAGRKSAARRSLNKLFRRTSSKKRSQQADLPLEEDDWINSDGRHDKRCTTPSLDIDQESLGSSFGKSPNASPLRRGSSPKRMSSLEEEEGATTSSAPQSLSAFKDAPEASSVPLESSSSGGDDAAPASPSKKSKGSRLRSSLRRSWKGITGSTKRNSLRRDESSSSQVPEDQGPVVLPLSTLRTAQADRLRRMGVDPLKKEQYLSDDEFEAVFRMSRQDFDQLPRWRQQDRKKQAGLF